jgi:hypothetical protein
VNVKGTEDYFIDRVLQLLDMNNLLIQRKGKDIVLDFYETYQKYFMTDEDIEKNGDGDDSKDDDDNGAGDGGGTCREEKIKMN